jgi:hypothetical protein
VGVGARTHFNVGQARQRIEIDHTVPKRRPQQAGPRRRQTIERDAVRRPNQHHPPDVTGPLKLRIRTGGNRPRVDVAGVGNDQRLGERRNRLRRWRAGASRYRPAPQVRADRTGPPPQAVESQVACS